MFLHTGNKSNSILNALSHSFIRTLIQYINSCQFVISLKYFSAGQDRKRFEILLWMTFEFCGKDEGDRNLSREILPCFVLLGE